MISWMFQTMHPISLKLNEIQSKMEPLKGSILD